MVTAVGRFWADRDPLVRLVGEGTQVVEGSSPALIARVSGLSRRRAGWSPADEVAGLSCREAGQKDSFSVRVLVPVLFGRLKTLPWHLNVASWRCS